MSANRTPGETSDTPSASHTLRSGYRTTPDPNETSWPAGVPYIVGNEACERFSYYGMRAILQVHITSLFVAQAFAESTAERSATQVVHLFMAGVYAFPMIGALIADRWAGKYRTIIWLSLVYCLGHAVLSVYENQLWGMYLGLALIAIGSGGIKPCVSAHVGDQFGEKNRHLLRAIYQIFYFSINFGSFFATLLIPFLRVYSGAWVKQLMPGPFDHIDDLRLGTSIAFGLPGVLMFIATIIFWLGRNRFVHAPPKPGGRIGLVDAACSVSFFLAVGHLFASVELLHSYFGAYDARFFGAIAVISAAFFGLGLYLYNLRQRLAPDDGFLSIMLHLFKVHLLGTRVGESNAPNGGHDLAKNWFWRPAVEKFGGDATEGAVAVYKIVSVFFLVLFFWALFDQHASTWITQAGQMDLWLWGNGNTSYFGISNFQLEASQVPAMNPALVMLLIPLLNLIYNLCDRVGLKATPLRRMTVGMFLTSLSFVATALLQSRIDAAPPQSVWFGWQLIQYVIITAAEVLVSITGLEFAYTQAPKKMKSIVMGFWLIIVTLGNVLVAVTVGLRELPAVQFFWLFAGLSAVAAMLFAIRAAFYKPRDYTQS